VRTSVYDIDGFFKQRFSPREFSGRMIEERDFLAILEAGSTAPSCFNEQPWRFVISQDKEKFLDILTPANREWAKEAAAFILICAEPVYARNGKENRYAAFDSGTSWGYMTYEAFRRGIFMHAMAGFDSQKAKADFEIDTLLPLAVIALGYTEQAHLMTPRRQLSEVVIRR